MRPPRAPADDDLGPHGVDRFHPLMLSSTSMIPQSEKASKARRAVQERMRTSINLTKTGDDVVIVPLGTSSAVPNKYRNGIFLSYHSIEK